MFNALNRLLGNRPSEPRFFTLDQAEGDVKAALESGEVTEWRVDAEGRQWYRRRPRKILGVGERYFEGLSR